MKFELGGRFGTQTASTSSVAPERIQAYVDLFFDCTNQVKGNLMRPVQIVRTAVMALAFGFSALAAQAAPVTTQLGFVVDSSGSIGAANFVTMRSGYAAALAALPTDGSIEVTMVRFASAASTIVSPTVVTAASLPGIIALVNGMAYTGGGTATNLGIDLATSLMTGSSEFSLALSSMMNIATDGVPNSQAAALASAQAAQSAGIDALTAEAVAAPASGIDAMRDIVFSPISGPCNDCGTVLPDGSIPPNPMTSNPWVLVVNNFADFPVAINAKIQASIGVPEPGALALAGIALAGLFLTRRRVS